MPGRVAGALLLGVTAVQDATAPRTEADRKILAEAESIEAEVARLRGRPFRGPVAKQVYSREQLVEFVTGELADPEVHAEIEKSQRFLRAIGFLPDDVDLGVLYRDLFGSQIAGFYDPKDRTLRCISTDLAFLQRLTLVHEIYHSLQDQYVPLEPYMTPDEPVSMPARRTDASRARQAVVEGDAQYFTMNQYSKHHGAEIAADLRGQEPGALVGFGVGQALAQAAIPPYFVEELGWPYLAGAEFIEALYDAGGWDAVDRAFTQPPVSTEQILHPRKFLDGVDPPLAVTAPVPAFAKDYEERFRDTIGEASLQTLLRHLGHDPVHATRGSEGWGGDEVVVLRGPDGDLLVWKLVFDTERDGEQFEVAWRRVLKKQFEERAEEGTFAFHEIDATALPEGARAYAEDFSGLPSSWLLRQGPRVLIVRGVLPDSLSVADVAALARTLAPF